MDPDRIERRACLGAAMERRTDRSRAPGVEAAAPCDRHGRRPPADPHSGELRAARVPTLLAYATATCSCRWSMRWRSSASFRTATADRAGQRPRGHGQPAVDFQRGCGMVRRSTEAVAERGEPRAGFRRRPPRARSVVDGSAADGTRRLASGGATPRGSGTRRSLPGFRARGGPRTMPHLSRPRTRPSDPAGHRNVSGGKPGEPRSMRSQPTCRDTLGALSATRRR